MDRYATHTPAKHDPPVIGYATHWDCHTAPETRSAFRWYAPALPELAKRYRVIAHAHPRADVKVWTQYAAMGLDIARDMQDFFDGIDLLVCDVGSAPYEFAATGRPVVVCNCPLYRRDVHHGLRFWDAIPGLQCDDAAALVNTVERALTDPPDVAAARRAAVETVYPNMGRATQIAADALEAWINGR